MTIQELMNKRAKAFEAMKTFLDTRTNEDGTMSAVDAETYDRMEQDIQALTDQINRQQRLEDAERRLNNPINNPILGQPGANGEEEPKSITGTKQYAADMLQAFRTQFRNITDALNEGTDSQGGYLVPDEWDARLIETLEDENIMRRLGTVIPTSGEHKIPIVASKPAAAWIDEGEALTFPQQPTFGQKTLDAHKLHVAVKITEELLYDNAYNLEARIPVMFAQAIANAEEDKFLTGNGTGEPTGIFDATSGGTSVGDAVAMSSNAIIDLEYALRRPYRKKAAFLMADATVASVRKLKDTTNGAYIWQPSYQAGEPDRLLGYPLYTSPYAPTNKVAFGDFSYYNIGDRGRRSFQILRELFAGNGMVGFVSKQRVDGILTLQEAVQILSLT